MQALTGRFGWRLSRRQQVQQFCRAVQHSSGGLESLGDTNGGLGVDLHNFRSSSCLQAPQLELLLPACCHMLPGSHPVR